MQPHGAAIAAGLMLTILAGEQAAGASYTAGAGTATCRQFIQDYGNDQTSELSYFAWAQGWMSGLNTVESAISGRQRALSDLSAVSADQQMQTIRAWCNDHPLSLYTQAVLFMRNHDLPKITLPPLPHRIGGP